MSPAIMRLSFDASRRADDLSAELYRAIARELVEDPTSETHTYVVLRALARCVGPALADAPGAVLRFWADELAVERRRAETPGNSGQKVDNSCRRSRRRTMETGKPGGRV